MISIVRNLCGWYSRNIDKTGVSFDVRCVRHPSEVVRNTPYYLDKSQYAGDIENRRMGLLRVTVRSQVREISTCLLRRNARNQKLKMLMERKLPRPSRYV
jgi:hypothetical protein